MLGVFSRIIKDKGYKVYSSSDCPSYTLYNRIFLKNYCTFSKEFP